MGRWGGFIVGGLLIAASVFIPPAGILGIKILSATLAFTLGTSLVLGGVASLIRGAPKKGGGLLDNPSGRTTNIRQAAAPARVGYGDNRIGGVITYADLTGDNNEYMRIVLTLYCHTITNITGVYFDGKLVTESTGSPPSLAFLSPYTDLVFMEINYGYDYQTALPQLMADASGIWTSTHRQRGYAHVYLRMLFDAEAFPNGLPNISFQVDAKQVYDPRDTTPITSGSDTTPVIITSAGHGLVEGDQIRVVGTTVDGEYFVSVLSSSTFELDGSTANGSFTGGTFGLYRYSRNWALVIADYLTNKRFGQKWVYSRINEDQLIIAANISDEAAAVPDFEASPGFTSEPRYTINGTFETSERPVDVLDRMVNAGAGHLVYVAGKWNIIPGAYRAPSLALSEGDIIGPISFDFYRTRRELPNGVKGTFVDPNRSWQETDYPAVSDAAALAEDNDERVWLDLSLPFTTSAFTAQRVASIQLRRARKQITGTIQTKLKGYNVQPGDSITLSIAHLGFVSKEFEVEEMSLVEVGSGDGKALGVQLSLQETDSTVYDDFEDYQEQPAVEPQINQNSTPQGPYVDDDDCITYIDSEGEMQQICPQVYLDVGFRFAVDETAFFDPFTHPGFRLQDNGNRIVYRKILTDISDNDIEVVSYAFDKTSRYLAVLWRLGDANKYLVRSYFLGDTTLQGSIISGEDDIYDLSAVQNNTMLSDDIDSFLGEPDLTTLAGAWIDVVVNQDGKVSILEATNEEDGSSVEHRFVRIRHLVNNAFAGQITLAVPEDGLGNFKYNPIGYVTGRIIDAQLGAIALGIEGDAGSPWVADDLKTDILHIPLDTPLYTDTDNVIGHFAPTGVSQGARTLHLHRGTSVSSDNSEKIIRRKSGQYVTHIITSRRDIAGDRVAQQSAYSETLGAVGSPAFEGFLCDANGEVRGFNISGVNYVIEENGSQPITPQGSPAVNELGMLLNKLTMNINPANGKIVTIGSITYTYKTSPVGAYDLQIEATAGDSLDNLKDAINGIGYAENPDVDCTLRSGTQLFIAPTGLATDPIVCTTDVGSASWFIARLPAGKGEECWRHLDTDYDQGFSFQPTLLNAQATAFGIRAEPQ